MLTTILAIIFVFGLLVFAHELGHFLVAKRTGVRVEEFAFGFPPRLLTLGRWGETKFTLNAIPLGGYVHMPGEDDPTIPGSFASRATGVRAAILVAGAAMNLVLAFLLFTTGATIGEPVPATTAVAVSGVAPASPADEAGLMVGDIILAVDEYKIDESSEMVAYTQQHLGQEMSLLVQRGEGEFTLVLVPRLSPPQGEGPLGVAIATQVTSTRLVSHPLWEAIPLGLQRTLGAIEVIIRGVIYMVQGIIAPEVAGPIGIAQITGEVAQLGPAHLIQLTGFLSVNLGLLNLLPFPGLDGGRLAFVVLEFLRRGKRVDPRREGVIHLIGIAILLGLVLVVSYFDILRVTGNGSG